MTNTLERIAKLLKIGAIGAIAVAVIKRIRAGRSSGATGAARWQPLSDPPPPPERTGPVQFEESFTRTWVEPVDGACPAGHPIKGNAGSGIFHVPGGGSYDRTIPERCYATAADAEADGFRQSKR